jgi:MraZ protein
MLLGEYEHTIDEKNRLTLPAKFRRAFADGIFVTKGFDPCLHAYTRDDWEQLVGERMAEVDPLSKEGRRLERFLFAGATEAELDRQGRVMIPAPLLEYAQIGREVVVAGVKSRVEIWDRARWREELAELEGGVEGVAERLANRT